MAIRGKPNVADFLEGASKGKTESTDVPGQNQAGSYRNLPLDSLVVSRYQVRKEDEDYIQDLMASIQSTKGLIAPVIVRPLDNGKFELVAGATRWEAYRRLGYIEIPAICRDMSDEEAARALAIDNLRRRDLSDYETYLQMKVLFEEGILKSNSDAARVLGRYRQEIIAYQAYGRLSAATLSLLEQRPRLFGATLAKELSVAIDSGRGERVDEAVQKLFSGEIKTQAGVLSWVSQRAGMTVPAKPREFRVTNDDGQPMGRVKISGKGIQVSGKGVDWIKLEEILRRELPNCLQQISELPE